MRIVKNERDFAMHFERATSEAVSSFGNGSVFIEKYIARPRHIEIQIFGDKKGNYVYLNERECSIQRRHQKVVEEAPSPIMTPALRKKMGEAAVKIAKSCNYHGAGTIEFLVDENHQFYFLEMNTRLQVEHPVTELTTGTDLVDWQIKVAFGGTLPLQQKDISIFGHAIELRVYAEDPFQSFLPSLGTLDSYALPNGKNVRVDNGVKEGQKISIHYDPLLAKLVVWGNHRSEAITNMKSAIAAYKIEGIQTTLPFGLFVLTHPNFISGDIDTDFIEHHFTHPAKEKFRAKNARIAAFAAIELQKIFLSKVTQPKGSASWKNRKQINK